MSLARQFGLGVRQFLREQMQFAAIHATQAGVALSEAGERQRIGDQYVAGRSRGSNNAQRRSAVTSDVVCLMIEWRELMEAVGAKR